MTIRKRKRANQTNTKRMTRCLANAVNQYVVCFQDNYSTFQKEEQTEAVNTCYLQVFIEWGRKYVGKKL